MTHHCLDPRKFYQFCCESVKVPECTGFPPGSSGMHDPFRDENGPPQCVKDGNCEDVPLEGSEKGVGGSANGAGGDEGKDGEGGKGGDERKGDGGGKDGDERKGDGGGLDVERGRDGKDGEGAHRL
ncbi:MAG: hypothetical protein Q9208_004849 [Pyrenodesmia sp. 3 TL-2023]